MDKTLDDHLLGNFDEGDFEFYKSFYQQEDALPYLELLKENNIVWRLEGSETIITEAIVGSPIFPKIVLRILPEDFKKVNDILEKEILSNAPDLEQHYLNDSTDHELLDILKKQDEFTIEEVIIAKELLRVRGIPIERSALEGMKQNRLEELQKGRDGNLVWMTIYMVLLVLGTFLYSPLAMLAGIGMGWYYWKDQSVDIDGNQYLTFNQKTRNFGIFILVLAVLVVLGWCIFSFTYLFREG